MGEVKIHYLHTILYIIKDRPNQQETYIYKQTITSSNIAIAELHNMHYQLVT